MLTPSSSTPPSCAASAITPAPSSRPNSPSRSPTKKAVRVSSARSPGGGRYDDLVKRFTGQAVPATGVSIGVDRLLAALREKGRINTDTTGPVVVTVMDRDRMGDYQAMATTLRNAGIRAEVYLGNPKNFGNQLKYADKRQSPVAIIQGSDEAERGVVQIKDLVLGAEIAETASVEEWKEQKQQFECPLDDMVAEVRKILESDRKVRHPGRGRPPAFRAGSQGCGGVRDRRAATCRCVVGPLRRGYSRPRLCHPRPPARRDDAAAGFHTAAGPAPHGRGARRGALCLCGRGVPAAGRRPRPRRRVPAGGL